MHAIETAENKEMVEMLLKVEGTSFVINFVVGYLIFVGALFFEWHPASIKFHPRTTL